MICFIARRYSTAYIDGRLRPSERSRVAAHVRHCDGCTAYFDQTNLLRSSLRQLSAPRTPPSLKTHLQVIASRELSRSRESRLEDLWKRWKFRLDEFMRPITIPATGGLLSSIALFFTLALSIGQTVRAVAYEVPLVYEDRADANLIPVDMRSSIVLTMSLDDKGRIRDYAVRDSVAFYTGDPARLVSNNISLPQFPSVLALTHPVSGAVRISLTPIVFRQ